MKKTCIIAIFALAVMCLTSCVRYVVVSDPNSNTSTTNNNTSSSYNNNKAVGGKCAVLDFQVGTNVTEEESDIISYNFRSNFHPYKYDVIDKKEMENLGYTNTKMTKQQMLEVGRKLEATYVVVGTLNKAMGEFSVDVQVINVSKGTTVATESSVFRQADYRNAVKNIAQKLASKIQ